MSVQLKFKNAFASKILVAVVEVWLIKPHPVLFETSGRKLVAEKKKVHVRKKVQNEL